MQNVATQHLLHPQLSLNESEVGKQSNMRKTL